jgi:hypothetical protein
VLAQFALKACRDYEKGEADAHYETRLALPDGWKLLTTASNISKSNGYFWAAYWHPEHQEILMAHRGTKLTGLGIFHNIVGVLFKHHVSLMGSARTFSYKIVQLLRYVDEEKRVKIPVFFTGH